MIRLPRLLKTNGIRVRRGVGGLYLAMVVYLCGLAILPPLYAQTGHHTPRQMLESARAFEAQQEYPEAISAYRDYLVVRPDDDEARNSLAKLLGWQGYYDQAVSLYRDILTRHPLDLEVQTALARVLSWQKHFDEAQQIFEAVLRDDVNQLDAMSGLADVLFWTGRGREALPYYKQVFAAAHDPEIGKRIDVINTELLAGPSSTAATTEASGVQLEQSGAARRLAEVRKLEAGKQYGEAIAAYRIYLMQRPDDDEARAALARLLAWEGNHAEAVVMYRDILSRHPADVDVRIALALTLSWQRRFEEARQLYEGVLHDDPENREAKKGLADITFWQGNRIKALELYESLYAETADPDVARQIKAVKEELVASPRAPVGEKVGRLRLPYRDYAKIGYGHYSYTKGIPDERDVLVEAGTSIGNKTLIARVEALNRFGFHDTPVSAEFYSALWSRAWGYIGAQATANPNFAPNYSAVGEVAQGLGAVHSALSWLELSFGYRHLLFKKDNIDLLLPSLTVYFPYNIWLTEKVYFVPDTGSITLASQLTWRPQDRLQFFASGSFGTSGERIVATQDFTRVQSRTIQGGVTFPLTSRLSAEASGYYEDRGILYVRRGGMINLIVHW
ncbi:tetratricopeptide repeat protein [Nitrospira sp. Nam74]